MSEPMDHDCVCCGIGPCDCAAVDPLTGEGCGECFDCNVSKERERDQTGMSADEKGWIG